MINKKEMEAVKNKIEKYYYYEKVIVWNQKELERLTKRLQDIEKDRNSPLLPVSLCTDLKVIRYDSVGGKSGGLPQSPMDSNIEAIYRKLDSNYEQTQQNILELKINIQKLEDERKQTEFYIHLLNEESKKILEYKYKQKKGVLQIAYIINLSKSSVSRLLCDTYTDLYKLMHYNKEI
mgnify:FL=1